MDHASSPPNLVLRADVISSESFHLPILTTTDVAMLMDSSSFVPVSSPTCFASQQAPAVPLIEQDENLPPDDFLLQSSTDCAGNN
jgi:hypothetical protein